MTDDQNTPPADETVQPPPAPEQTTAARAPRSSSTTAPRYAAYDTRLTRYVGGVYDTKGEARDAAKARKVKASDVRIDEV